MHNYEAPNLHQWLDAQSGSELDQLPYGVVKMDHQGFIQAYNQKESAYTGVAPENAVGKHLFTEVALCTNNFMIAGKLDQPEVDVVLDYVFTYVMKPTPVRLRLLKSDSPNMYMIVAKK